MEDITDMTRKLHLQIINSGTNDPENYKKT